MEFGHRWKKKLNLKVGEKYMEYPIADQYKYLGTWLNPRMKAETHLKQVVTRTNIIQKKN